MPGSCILRSLSCVLSILVITSCATDEPAPLEGEPGSVMHAAVKTAPSSIIIKTSEFDYPGDDADFRVTETFHLDQHGKVFELVNEYDSYNPAYGDGRFVTTSTYNRHGNLVARVTEIDNSSGGVWLRTTLSTTRYDHHGNPIEQLEESDYDGDGSVEASNVITIRGYTPRGKAVEQFTQGITMRFEYDNREYVTGMTIDYDREDGFFSVHSVISREYSAHGAIIASEELTQETGLPPHTSILRTIEMRSGDPTHQVHEYVVDYDPRPVRVDLVTTYDNRHRPITRIESWDGEVDGSVDLTVHVAFEYQGTVRTPGPLAWRDLVSRYYEYESLVTNKPAGQSEALVGWPARGIMLGTHKAGREFTRVSGK